MSHIICVKPKGIDYPEEVLKECFKNYNNGIGLCYSLKEKIIIKKGFKSIESLMKELQDLKEKACLITFSNRINQENHYTQPFKLGDNYAAAYQGKILTDSSSPKNESDVYNFHLFLKTFWTPSFFGKEYFACLLGKSIGLTSIVIMNNEGEYNIYNSSRGINLYKCWFSESPYLASRSRTNNNHLTHPYHCNHSAPVVQPCHTCKSYYTISNLKLNNTKYYCQNCLKIHQSSDKIIQFPRKTNDNHEFGTRNNFLKHITNPDLINIFDIF